MVSEVLPEMERCRRCQRARGCRCPQVVQCKYWTPQQQSRILRTQVVNGVFWEVSGGVASEVASVWRPMLGGGCRGVSCGSGAWGPRFWFGVSAVYVRRLWCF